MGDAVSSTWILLFSGSGSEVSGNWPVLLISTVSMSQILVGLLAIARNPLESIKMGAFFKVDLTGSRKLATTLKVPFKFYLSSRK